MSAEEEQLQDLFSHAAVGMALIGPDGQWLRVNQRYCEMLAYSEAELRKKTLQDLTHPQDWQAVLSVRQRMLAGEFSSNTTEKRYVRKDGKIYWGRLHRSLVRGADNRPKYFVAIVEDITQQIEAERAVRESEQSLALAQKAAHLAVWNRDLSTNVISISGEYREIYKLAEERRSLTFEEWMNRIHPDDRERLREHLREALTQSGVFDQEFRIKFPDGTVRWLLGQGTVLKDNTGRPVRIAGVNLDITERKKAELELQRSEERFRLAILAINDAIWDVDLKAGTVAWNEAYSRLYGRPTDTAGSLDWWIENIHEDDRERTVSSLRSAISGTASSWSGEYRFRRADGAWAYINDRAYIARDASGDAYRVIGALQDLTERHRAEAALRESEQRFRDVADSAPVMIWMSGADKLCTFFNKVWLAFTGRTMEQELGNGWAEVVHPDDLERCLDTYNEAFDARRAFEVEYRLQRADGEYRWILDQGIPRFAPDGVFVGYIGSCIDLTNLKIREQEHISAQKLESLGTVTAGIAHDMNNLLSGIIANADWALTDPESSREAVEKIKIVARHGTGIVHDLMLYAGKDQAEIESVDVSRLIEEMINFLKASVPKRAKLTTALREKLTPVLANSSQIRQVVVNLVVNAAEAIGEKGGSIVVTTSTLSITPDYAHANIYNLSAGEYVRLEVSDTGQGMSDQLQAKIFDPFFTTKEAGRGLGLAVTQAIVHKYRGVIHIESAPGKGTRMEVLLPCAGSLTPRS